MIQIQKEQIENKLYIRLSGSVDESTNFDSLVGPVPAELIVNCKEINRINSVGVKAWIKFFSNCSSRGVKIKFLECSTSIVEQLNMISNFNCLGVVESIYVPYACSTCKKELLGLYKTEDIKKNNSQAPSMDCGQPQCKAEFDDIEEEYFSFLSRENHDT